MSAPTRLYVIYSDIVPLVINYCNHYFSNTTKLYPKVLNDVGPCVHTVQTQSNNITGDSDVFY